MSALLYTNVITKIRKYDLDPRRSGLHKYTCTVAHTDIHLYDIGLTFRIRLVCCIHDMVQLLNDLHLHDLDVICTCA